jgi:hypothetical protein
LWRREKEQKLVTEGSVNGVLGPSSFGMWTS